MKNYKYDLEFIIPVSLKDKFGKRLDFFLRNGLQKCGDYKVLINFLIGTEFVENNFVNNFSKNVEFRIISSSVDHPAAKVYDFYLKYDDFDRSKWIVRLDDDSVTNVELLMNFLKDLDCDNFYYFIGEQTEGDIRVSMDLLNKFNKLGRLKNQLMHEVEIAVISNATYNKVIKSNIKEIEERSKIEDGYTDQLLCYLCKISGIFPSNISILSYEAKVYEFITNKIAHIHKICYDKNLGYTNMLDEIQENKGKEFCDVPFVYYKDSKDSLKEQTNRYFEDAKIIYFCLDNTIFSKDRIEEKYWSYNGINFKIYDSYGVEMAKFNNFNFDKKNECKTNYKNIIKECYVKRIDL